MEEMIYEFQSEGKHSSQRNKESAKMSAFKSEENLKQNWEDLEQIRLQLQDHHYLDLESDECGHAEFCSPSALEYNSRFNCVFQEANSLNGGDKGGSSIMKRNEQIDQSDYESAIMPRKLNLKIHTNINDNFDILSSERSSIIERIHQDVNQVSQPIDKESFQATGETCIIICDENDNSEQLKSTLDCNQNYQIFKLNNQHKIDEEYSEKETVIVHKNMPSNENIYNFNDESKNQEDDLLSSIKSFKRPKSYHEIAHDPSSQTNMFRRVECTSSYKKLPKINNLDCEANEYKEQEADQHIHSSSVKHNKPVHYRANKNIYKQPVNHLEIQLNESSDDKNNQEYSSNIFKRKKREGIEPKSIGNEFKCDINEELAIDNIYHQPSKSEMMITPKEREEVPRAFKRLQQDCPQEQNNQKGQQSEFIRLKRENNKLKRELETQQQKYYEEIQEIK